MAIRIDMKSEGPEVVVYLAGRLSDEDVIKQLRDTCDSIKGSFEAISKLWKPVNLLAF
jgi:hypothetical protein